MDPRAAVAGLDLAMDGLDRYDQGALPGRPDALRPPPPVVVAARGDAQDPAHQPDRPSLAVAFDEVVPHDDSLAKKAVAFFRMSRSIVSRLFSARSRRNSSSIAGGLPLPGKAWS